MVMEQELTRIPVTEEGLYEAIGVMAAGAGLSPPLVLKSLRRDVRATTHPKRGLTNLHRFLSTGFSSSLLRDFQEHQLLQQIALEIFSQSQFLADILVRNPELFHWLTSTNVLKVAKTNEEYAMETFEAMKLFQRMEKKLDSLKRFQRRELLRVGARQLLKEADVSTTSAELSSLADAIIECVLQLGLRHLAETIPLDSESTLAVVGLGKLGGGELNFSSDIDLMFVYDEDGPLGSPASRLSTLHEYYSRLAEFVVRRLSEHTAEGHLYRVDMRLRPEGHSGPLAMSRSAYMSYYEARGELWERQMLLKSRIVAGNRTVGEGWLNDIQPFVYPKTLLGSPLEEIAKIKAKIEARRESDSNIKLGSGGIRDIEFIAQALQLLNAGHNVLLRERNTLHAVHRLVEASLLKKEEGEKLQAAYIFLRTVEDRLQLFLGLQKHSVPHSQEEKLVLARQLGFGSSSKFEGELGRHRRNIQAIFRSVFGVKGGRGILPRAPEVKTDRVAVSTIRLKKFGFRDNITSAQQLSVIIKELPELEAPHRMSSLLALMRNRGAPDWCLSNFLLLASAQPIKRTLQQALTSEKLLDLLLMLCARSSRFARLLAQEPLLFESLVGRPEDMLNDDRSWEFLKQSDLMRYRVYNEFKAGLRLLVADVSIRQFTRALSLLADEIVSDAFLRTRDNLQTRGSGLKVSLVALGKYGGEEITIGSDLDLILIYKGDERSATQRQAQQFAREFSESLNSVYEVDFRLRPEGKSSPLATDFEYYKTYLRDRASLWERQSLVKARLIASDASFGTEVMKHLLAFTYRSPLPTGWTKELRTMRKKMESERTKAEKGVDLKVGSGGLVDLEFLLQALQLQFGGAREAATRSNSFELLDEMMRQNILKKAEGRKLAANLEYLRLLETFVRLNSDTTSFVLPMEKERLQALAVAMGERSLRSFLGTIRRTRQENRALFSRLTRLHRE
jgi:glutamate-ammonia-ligase adenylyltransferase